MAWNSSESGGLYRESLRHRNVIGIHACNERCSRCPDAEIKGGDNSFAPCPKQSDTRVERRKRRKQHGRFIRGPVVDNDKLEIGKRLRKNAVNRVVQKSRAIAHRHHHRYFRSFVRHLTPVTHSRVEVEMGAVISGTDVRDADSGTLAISH